MTLTSNVVVGVCTGMCPDEEIREREKCCLIHNLEAMTPDKRQRFRKPDRRKMVKAYHRPAAGKEQLCPSLLRPFPTLLQTTDYLIKCTFFIPYIHTWASLCSNLLNHSFYPWDEIYDFVSDRLRSVRQDAVIQRVNASNFRILLEQMFPFYLYWNFVRSCQPDKISFDLELHETQTREVITLLIEIYAELRHFDEKLFNFLPEIFLFNTSSPYFSHSFYERFRPLMPNFNNIFRLYSGRFSGDHYVNFFRLLKRSSFSIKLILFRMVPNVRLNAFGRLSKAYGHKQIIPLNILAEWLDYPNVENLKLCLCDLHHEIVGNTAVKFCTDRNELSCSDTIKPHWHCCKSLKALKFNDLL